MLPNADKPALPQPQAGITVEKRRCRTTEQVPGECPVDQPNGIFKCAGPSLTIRIRTGVEPGFEQAMTGAQPGLGFRQVIGLRQTDQLIVAVRLPQILDIAHQRRVAIVEPLAEI